MKSFFLFNLTLLLLFTIGPAVGQTLPSSSTDKTADSTPSITSASTPSNSSVHSPSATKALIVHKPMPSPSWGKVIQYHREENFVLSDKNRETLHEFLFQDDSGIIRTAIFHENASGDGYWEVWVWDQP